MSLGNHNYRKGRAREYRVKKKLLGSGALWVVRSYGSHGLFDLTAVFPDHVELIQVKKDRIPKEEMQRLEEFASRIVAPNVHVLLYIRNGFVRLGRNEAPPLPR